ncbi:thiamine pyrophosphate enzyme domain protein TPP-binding protein [Magnetococcus marinus MC-1]|uniref:Thiamine pyrophosphate enzyme domain protein TPP-binding protein n=1 Tax=Magnetococcus marinus (strain ATCC BAA-1437 / JCM 17883 / MC-1) TaxID=156889 RepID=A0L8F7_MAGMM|nr:thiamine pyrophosphate-dependent enzyme [Magnetococcus marinus]ABK44250.1 thiamine pyrophosphate enzyme domain protein TPP-binding protein [Magnetococcus marinus MC-1]
MSQAKIYSENTPQWYDVDRAKEILHAYNTGQGSGQPADRFVACSAVPAGTGSYRDFSYIAPDLPEYMADNCVACMECVQNCPDSAIWGRVMTPETLEAELAKAKDDTTRDLIKAQMVQTTKFWKTYEKKKEKEPDAPGGAEFGIFIDPTKCKGCGECVVACGEHDALKMIKKTKDNLPNYFSMWEFYKNTPSTPEAYINPKLKIDIMLRENANQYVGGAGSCMGCGEASVIRQLLAMTHEKVGHKYGITAATGCNTVYGSTYPYNPFRVPWMNSLFENAPTVAMGVRAHWDRTGKEDHVLWAFGGDGAMLDIGFQALSRMLTSGMNIKVLVLDTQVYSNTGGQASTATFIGQEAKMSVHGKSIRGKMERRKEIGMIAMMHPHVYVAQTVGPMTTHFYKSVERALEYNGPALINVYTTCQPEHQVADDLSYTQALLAVESRAFPVFTYDPEAGETMAERMSLQGNPSVKRDWHHKKTKEGEEQVNFITFARTEGRFQKHFDKDGNHSPVLDISMQERLENWRKLQDLAGVSNSDWEAERAAKKAKK